MGGNPEIGVLSVAIAVVSDFYRYKAGVYSGAACGTTSINHAVDIVGYGVMDGKNYYRVRNSWGANWGDKGYINMARQSTGDGICQLAKYSHYPVVTGSSDDQEEEDGDDNDGDDGDDGDDDKRVCAWLKTEKAKFKGKVQGCSGLDEDAAKKMCSEKKECKGITCHKKKKCSCVKKTKAK